MKRSQIYILLFFIAVTVSSCTYDFIKKAEPVNPSTPVSFATQILPIFNNNSNCTACHKPGGEPPDYTTANAYNSIISNNVVNTSAPETSLLYTFPAPATGTHTWKKYTDNQAQLVLLWIQQGANNN